MLPLLLLLASGATGPQGDAGGEVTEPAESIVVLEHEDISGGRFWKVVDGTIRAPPYPRDLVRAGISGCVSIGFVIESDGTESELRVLKTEVVGEGSRRTRDYAEKMFVASAAEMIRKMRFSAGDSNPRNVRGISYMPVEYTAPLASRPTGCKIASLATFLRESAAKPNAQNPSK